MSISLNYGGRGGVKMKSTDIPCCDICFIPLDEQDVSHIARWFHCDSMLSQDSFFFLMENEMYPTENSSNSGGVLAHEQKPCKMKQNQQNQIRQRYFNPAIIYDTI